MTQSQLFKSTKLPLSLAIGSCLLVACSSTPTTTQTTTASTPIYNPQNSTTTQTNSSILDAETLAILGDLLEARDMSMVEGDRLAVEQYGDLWDRVRRGYRIAQPNYNPRIDAQKSWFSSRQDYLDRLTARASRYLHHTVTEAERRGIPTELALLPIIESSYDPAATSNAAAAGLWQFIPSTGRIYGLNQSSTYDGRRDVIESTRAAYDFLTSLYNQFGSWELALAAYNAGPGRIQRAIDANRAQGLPTDYWSLRLPTETMNYVPRFMAVAQIVANPKGHGVYLPAIANHNHFRAVPVQYGATLYDVSSVTNIPVSELQLLNPALTNLVVDAAGPSRVVIPDSLPVSVDEQLRKLGNQGYGNITAQTGYVVPRDAVPNPSSANQLSAANTFPTTAASITSNKTIVQEPPLSQEEVDFIAAQIRNTESSAQPISSTDGAITLNSVQTAQSVLEARNQTKSLRFDGNTTSSNITSPSYPRNTQQNTTQQSNTQSAPRSNITERYTIRSGDTLTSIAARHNLSLTQLAAYNNISVDAKVQEGRQLWLVPGKVSSTTQTTQTSGTRTTSYKVQRGDTLIGLAARLGISKSELAALNGLSDNANLIADTTIKIPEAAASRLNQSPNSQTSSRTTTERYTIRSGDTLTSIAARHNLSLTQLAAYNNISVDTKVQEGRQLWLVPGKVSSTTQTTQTSGTRTTSYKVQRGDTLIGLAARLGISKSELAALNGLSDNANLIADTTIKIPVLSTSATNTRNTNNRYTIQAGDTLTGVAAKHGVSLTSLAAANNLSETAGLIQGRTLIIPTVGAQQNVASGTQNSQAGRVIANTESYQVKQGDTLTALASRFGVSIADLARTNNLANNARLQIGQTILVPKLTTTYTVKRGDTLIGLAQRYGIQVDELAAMNNIKSTDGLRIGQRLIVPNQ